MIKKVFLNGRFLTRPMSGVQRTAYEIVKALDELIDNKQINADNISFILIYSGEIVNPIELNHIVLLKKGRLSGNLWEQLELPIYTFGSLLVSMCSISTLFKSKQLLVVHDASFFVNKQFFSAGFRLWYNFAIPFIAKICRQIITVSEFSKNELAEYGGIDKKKITVIYNAADHILRFGEPSPEFQENISALKPYCLAVSSLGANKNFSGLTKAIGKIEFKKFNMLIAGGAMNTLKYSAPESGVTYLGYVSNEELRYLYKNSSLFIFPSFYEGFGIPPLEAMISHCPVIASNTSSIPEVLGDSSNYFDPADPDDMAKEISALIVDNEKLKQLEFKGYKRASQFSWKSSGMKYFDLIQRFK